MNTNNKTIEMKDMKVKLSALWIVVMFNMLFADVLMLFLPGFLQNLIAGTTSVQITQELMLVMAIIIEIPIAMIFLSRVLKPKANRVANIIAAIITILFVTAGGSLILHYIFFATIEVVALLAIIVLAWKLK